MYSTVRKVPYSFLRILPHLVIPMSDFYDVINYHPSKHLLVLAIYILNTNSQRLIFQKVLIMSFLG